MTYIRRSHCEQLNVGEFLGMGEELEAVALYEHQLVDRLEWHERNVFVARRVDDRHAFPVHRETDAFAHRGAVEFRVHLPHESM